MTPTQTAMPVIPCDYPNDGFRITSPGKFEGEPIFAPHLWDLGMQGFYDSDDGNVFTFHFTKADKLANPALAKWLGRKRTVRLSEDSQGFVRCF